MDLAQSLQERDKAAKCIHVFLNDAIWVKVHNIVPDAAYSLKTIDERLSIYDDSKTIPVRRVLKQALVLAQRQIPSVLNRARGIAWISHRR